MYDQITWADIRRWEAAEDEHYGECSWCGKRDDLNAQDECVECEAERLLEARLDYEADRMMAIDEGMLYDDDLG